MKVLVTGVAGFIGSHVAHYLINQGNEVVGIDNLNDYYDVSLKEARLIRLKEREKFSFIWLDIADREGMVEVFRHGRFRRVIHLAAQAGVRFSIEDPHVYINANIVGFMNVLEGCRYNSIEHLVYASTSSVYGSNTTMPFSEHHLADHPLTIYAATKRANELMAHSYSHLFQLPTTGLRFFTVYGPWGRPDMALFKFTKSILDGQPIEVFNYGKHKRDFTFIDDIVEGVVRVCDKIPLSNSGWDSANPDPATSRAPFRIYNIGNNQPVDLMRYIETLEGCLGRKAVKTLLPMQLGDVPDTYANVTDLVNDIGFKPSTSVEEGVSRFVEWYMRYYSKTYKEN